MLAFIYDTGPTYTVGYRSRMILYGERGQYQKKYGTVAIRKEKRSYDGRDRVFAHHVAISGSISRVTRIDLRF
jgi:hypothetical protein